MAKKEKKYNLPVHTRFTDQLLPVIFNLASKGYSEADIGLTLGYTGDVDEWVKYLKKQHPEVADAIETGGKLANVALVSRAFEIATGLASQPERIRVFKQKYVGTGEDGKPKFVRFLEKDQTKDVPIKPDGGLLWKLLCSRLPEYFREVSSLKIDNRSVMLNADFAAEVSELAGNLIEAVQKKKVESVEIEKDE